MYYVIKKAKFNCRKKKFISNYKCNKKKFGIYPKTWSYWNSSQWVINIL